MPIPKQGVLEVAANTNTAPTVKSRLIRGRIATKVTQAGLQQANGRQKYGHLALHHEATPERRDDTSQHVRQGVFEDPPDQDQHHSASSSIGTAEQR